MRPDESQMSDAQAIDLLWLLDLYVGLPDSDEQTPELTIRMVVEDLLGSLPRGSEPKLAHFE
jgi:hypothetical protein